LSRKTTLALFLGFCLVLIVALLLAGRTPVDAGDWKGKLHLTTPTPSVSLLPEAGWWNQITAPAGQFLSTITPTP
jgi:hypothetical protein